MESNRPEVTFLVVGGGIAGVSCAETLAACCPSQSIMLLSESEIVKTTSNLKPVARYLFKFDIKEDLALEREWAPCITIKIGRLSHIEAEKHEAITQDSYVIKFRYLCICTGGVPRLIKDCSCVIGIRDTDSVQRLQARLKNSNRVIIIGNGGIASELAHSLENIEVHWIIKDSHISSTFIDAGAAEFFLQSKTDRNEVQHSFTSDEATTVALAPASILKTGSALGPNWHKNVSLKGDSDLQSTVNKLTIYYNTQIQEILEVQGGAAGAIVLTTTGLKIHCDFIVSAIGVQPRCGDFSCSDRFEIADDGGIKVDEMMQTNIPSIYAAGDVCTAAWPLTDHWFQMRLWTQARQMGIMAGRSMAAAFRQERIYQDFCFEIFGHMTRLFGYEVALIGRYNGQGLGSDYEILLRMTPGKEYLKLILLNGRLRGAILIGDTSLAETCENLILNGIDLSIYGEDILSPDIDIEDYFD